MNAGAGLRSWPLSADSIVVNCVSLRRQIAPLHPVRNVRNPSLRHSRKELYELLIKLALPVLIGHLSIIGLSVTDIVLSGHVGRQDLAGVMLGATLFDLPMMFVLGIFIANSTLIGRLHGRDDHEGLNRHFQNTLWLTLPVGLVIAVAVYLMRILVLPLLDATPAVKAVANGYLIPMTGTAFLLPMLIALRTTLEATGHQRVAMAFNLMGFLINIPLDLAFIYGCGPIDSMGGIGCGWATLLVVATIISGVQICVHSTAKYARFHTFNRLQRPSWMTMRQILQLGTPMGGAILSEAGFFHVIPIMAAQLGTLALASHAVSMSFDMVMFMLPFAISQAITIRIANSVGRGDRSQHIARTGMKVVLVISLLQAVLVMLFRNVIPRLYSDDLAVTEVAATLLFVAAFVRVFDGLNIAGGGVLRGYGKTRSILMISVSAFWLVGAPLAWMSASGIVSIGQSPIQDIWYAILAAVAAACAMTLWRVRRAINERN